MSLEQDLLSVLQSADKPYQQSLIAKVGRIVPTESLAKEISMAKKKKVVFSAQSSTLNILEVKLSPKWPLTGS